MVDNKRGWLIMYKDSSSVCGADSREPIGPCIWRNLGPRRAQKGDHWVDRDQISMHEHTHPHCHDQKRRSQHTRECITSHHITSHHITPQHDTTPQRTTPIASHPVASHCTTLHRIQHSTAHYAHVFLFTSVNLRPVCAAHRHHYPHSVSSFPKYSPLCTSATCMHVHKHRGMPVRKVGSPG